MGPIHSHTDRVRLFIQILRRLNALSTSAHWGQLCSALDVLEDTELAVEGYYDQIEEPDTGRRYLLVYGVLQVLYVQQDALCHLHQAFSQPFTLSESLKEIRGIRNASIGHPTRQDRAKPPTSNFIIRTTLLPTGFDLLLTHSDRDSEVKHVPVKQVCERQMTEVAEHLRILVDRLEGDEMEHRERHRANRMSAVFPHSMRYFAQKVQLAAVGLDTRGSWSAEVAMLRSGLVGVENRLSKRGELGGPENPYVELKEAITYSLDRLERYLQGGERSWTRRDAEIYGWYLRDQVGSLVRLGEEIDQEYDTDIRERPKGSDKE